MAAYVYPALFHANEDGSYTVTYPDLPGCISEGESLDHAMYMAQDALSQWIAYAMDAKEQLPPASRLQDIETEDGTFANLIRAELRDTHAVRRTVSLPKWMDDKVSEVGLSLSRVLQDALRERFD